MAIPEEKLESWSAQGATVTSKATYKSVRKALETFEDLKGINFDIYLQGSYKNNTNILGESDVDIVVQLDTIFNKDLSSLTSSEKNLYKSVYKSATYSLSEFKNIVLEALKSYYTYQEVSEGDKCIKVAKNSNRLDADIIVCNQYRKYKQFTSVLNQSYVEGIIFNSKSGRTIISYPKVHYDNGSTKNSETKNKFKPTVRLFKNARSYMINNGIIESSLAPSFFVESLLYNVPNNLFVNKYSTTYLNVLGWIADILSKDESDNLLCQDEQLQLFGDSPEQWNKVDCINFAVELLKLWKDW